jgi:D-alanyl-D-alanine carboxypeptidase (penicillin-binding protein 5/6)
MRLVSVILGAPHEKARRQETARLLSWGFNTFSKVPLVQAGVPMGKVRLDWGLEPEVQTQSRDTVVAVLSPLQEKQLVRKLELPAELPAPVRAGEGLGLLEITLGDSLLAQVNLVAEKSVGRMGLWEKFMSYF